MIREIPTPESTAEIVEFLDNHTLIHRWLVAFFRHLGDLPPEAVPYWSFWDVFRGGPGRPKTGRAGIIAHSFHTATTYAVLAPGFPQGGIETLLETDLYPEKLVGDGPVLEEWEAKSPAFFSRAVSREELVVLDLPPGRLREGLLPAAGFRPAVPGDGPTLRQFELLYALDMGEEDPATDLASLIARGLIFVIEEDGEVAGTIRSNLPDGRWIHAGGVYVHPCFRGRGIGRRLVAGLSERVHREGLSVLLDTSRTNVAALETYRSAGFVEIGTGKSFRFGRDGWGGGG